MLPAIILAACITIPENPAYCNFDPSWQQNQLYYDQQDAQQAIQSQLDDIQLQQIINNDPRYIDPNAQP